MREACPRDALRRAPAGDQPRRPQPREEPELRALLEALGYGDVITTGQTGNVALTAGTTPEALADAIRAAVLERLGVDAPVIVRTRDELAAVIALNPLGEVAADPKRHQVTFLAAVPEPAAVRELLAVDVAPERLVVEGREAYAWHPDGVGRSRLAALLGRSPVGRTGTARNWNAVCALLAAADQT